MKSSVDLLGRFLWICAAGVGMIVVGGANMKILDMLYDGRIYPAETVKPATEKYRQLDEERKNLLDKLREKLSDTDQQLLDRIDTLAYGISDEECRCMFAEGVRFGVGLMKELGEMDRQDK